MRNTRRINRKRGGCEAKPNSKPIVAEIPPGWGKCKSKGGLDAIGIEIVWKSFMDGQKGIGIWNFLTNVVSKLNSIQHHPEIFNSYTNLIIVLTTHDSCGVTELDIISALYINGLLEEMNDRVKSVQPHIV
jgi:pterin-4a-carbinolamine dehydratase